MPQWPTYQTPRSPYDPISVWDLFPTDTSRTYFAEMNPQEQVGYLLPAFGWNAGSDAARMAQQQATSNYWLNRLANPASGQETVSYAQWLADRMRQSVMPDYGWSGRQDTAMRRLAEASQLGELSGQIAVSSPTAAEQRGLAEAALGMGMTPWARAALNRRLSTLENEYRANTSLAPTFLNFLRQRGLIAGPTFTDPTAPQTAPNYTVLGGGNPVIPGTTTQSPYGGNAPASYNAVTGQAYPA